MIDYLGWWDLKVVRNIAQSAKCTTNRENQARIAKGVKMKWKVAKIENGLKYNWPFMFKIISVLNLQCAQSLQLLPQFPHTTI